MNHNYCLICDSTSCLKQFGTLSVLVCSNCGHGYMSGRKEENELFETEDYAVWRTQNIDHLKSEARKKMDIILKLTKSVPKTVLEYGCSTGEVLAEFSKAGSRCYGIDLSEVTIKIAKQSYSNITFKRGTKPDDDQNFDLIVACHVLEHIEDVKDFLDTVNLHLNENGYIYLSVPNFASLSRMVLNKYWPDFMPEHLQYFTPKSLKYLLETNGLEVVSTRTNGRAWQWLGGLKRVLKKKNSTKEKRHSPSIKAMMVLRLFDKLLAPLFVIERLFGIGSELIIIGEKNKVQ